MSVHKKNWSIGVKLLVYIFTVAPLFLIILVPSTIWYLNAFHSSEKVCTVDSAKIDSDSSGVGSPNASVFIDIKSSDCGDITIARTKHPSGVNAAKLAEILNAHQGEKFEFVIKYVQLGGDSIGSTGVTSTTPVN